MANSARARLRNAAEELFYDKGFHGTGIDRIASHAGVARMTLSDPFGSKDGLVAAILADRNHRLPAQCDGAVVVAGPGGATRAAGAAHNDWVPNASWRGCLLVRAMAADNAPNPDIAHRATAHKQALGGRLVQALADDGYAEPDRRARQLFPLLAGSIGAAAVYGPEGGLADVMDAAAHLFPAMGGTA